MALPWSINRWKRLQGRCWVVEEHIKFKRKTVIQVNGENVTRIKNDECIVNVYAHFSLFKGTR